MSVYLKPILIFVISAFLFTGAVFLFNEELDEYVQTRLYNPGTVKTVLEENRKNAEIVQNHLNNLQEIFASTLSEPAVRSSFLYNQSSDDIFQRSRIYGILHETIGTLQSVQFVDSNGIRLHYSTVNRDIISQNNESAVYRNYTEDSRALPYETVSVPANGKSKYTMDDIYDRIIFSHPFYDSMDIYRGTALFSVSVRSITEKLAEEGRINANDNISLIRFPPGVIMGNPDTSKKEILEKISGIWADDIRDYITLDSAESGVTLALISSKTDQNLFFGILLNNALFAIPESMNLILRLSIFLTLYLTLLMLVSIKPHPVTLVKNRIKTLRADLFEQLYVKKNSKELAKWILELEQRREEIHLELKRGIKTGKRTGKNIDIMIGKAWDELLAVIKAGNDLKNDELGIKSEELKTEEVEVLEEIGEAEEIEALEEIGEAEEIEALEEIGEAEEIEALEEISEAEEIEALEEIGEAEENEEFIDVETFQEVEEIEILEEISEAEEAWERKGLLILSTKIIDADKAAKPAQPAEEHTEEYANNPTDEKDAISEEITKISKGLLALSNERYREIHNEQVKTKQLQTEPENTTRGLLALASDIEFNSEYPASEENDNDLETMRFDIVSPLSEMFGSNTD